MLLFIDTNIFVQSQYGWSSGKLAIIRKLAQSGWINILSHVVVKEEINQNIACDLKQGYECYNNFVKKSKIRGYNKEVGLNIRPIEAERYISAMQEKCNEYFSGDGVIEVPIPNKGINVLVSDYINKSYPFEVGKPNEFKDAIIAYSLKEFQAKQEVPVIIYSLDKGFNKAFESNQNFIIIEEFCEILNMLEDNLPSFIQKHLLKKLNENKTKVILEDYLSEMNIELVDDTYFIDSLDIMDNHKIEISNLRLEDFNIVLDDSSERKENWLNFRDTSGYIFATIEVFFDIGLCFTVVDADRSYYDEETRDYIIKSYIDGFRGYSTSYVIELELGYVINDGLIEFEDISVSEDNDILTLYEYELFDQSYSSSYDENYIMPFKED